MENELKALIDQLSDMPLSLKIIALNKIKTALHEISPFRDEPIDCVLWVPTDDVRVNDYNPNSVAPPEMRLLQHSIDCDGYTQPVVVWDDKGQFRIVDGEHRHKVGSTVSKIRKRILNHLPVTVIRKTRGGESDRMASTIRHNRARGTHAVTSMTDIVASMLQDDLNDTEVAKELGMDADELLRFKQNKGMPDLFKDHDYSKAWEV